VNALTWLLPAGGLLIGAALGVLLHRFWVQRHAERKLRLPARWLLNARGLVTSEEMDVWKWLRMAFPDHAVMVKVPVMRFTVPSTRDKPQNKDQHWHELLNGVYCSFTVSTLDGKVVGCVDVPGKRGLTKAQRDMKESMLMECGIGYTTVRSGSLPSASAMRTAFLGEAEIIQQDAEETRGGDSSFHAALTEFTSEKVRAAKAAAIQELKDKQAATTETRGKNANVGFNPDGTGSFMAKEKPDRFATKWEDSFTMGESRPAKL
jgi:hypothetical protein